MRIRAQLKQSGLCFVDNAVYFSLLSYSMGSNAFQLFLVEAKVSKSEFIKRIKLKGVETYTVDNIYSLLLEPSTIFEQ
jgi:hypothetical protein